MIKTISFSQKLLQLIFIMLVVQSIIECMGGVHSLNKKDFD